ETFIYYIYQTFILHTSYKLVENIIWNRNTCVNEAESSSSKCPASRRNYFLDRCISRKQHL
ncbi:MAG: hypothetical protein OEY79_05055, partial [Anaplasmataceae bacterium]|nr:hypothetical protein [Anaplasmataceae bacterium]